MNLKAIFGDAEKPPEEPSAARLARDGFAHGNLVTAPGFPGVAVDGGLTRQQLVELQFARHSGAAPVVLSPMVA